eukprot:TRINITY_DN2836_c0_g2_i1.p1 TRINITY_DN2836_c0_g2~~TRINITY_DN2836_c0_g2_i1.p1  ORF type:complete len:487 (-),score=17.19 TRINITY_DN2836_c0_g2_i1:536-1957(-)
MSTFSSFCLAGMANELKLDVEDPSLLRGTRLVWILSGMGRHFKMRDLANSEFTETEAQKLYSRSHMTEWFDGFISHCWRSERVSKYVALSCYANQSMAMVLATIAALIAASLTSLGILPHAVITRYYDGNGQPVVGSRSPWSICVGCVSYLTILFWGHVIADCIGRGRVYFFDKLCVHQFDTTKKTGGVGAFAAFVHHSKELVMLWDEHYLERLWCTLELATLVHVHRDKERLPLTFIPLKIALVGFLAGCLWMITITMFTFNFVFEVFPRIPIVLTACLGSFAIMQPVLLKYVTHRKQLTTQFQRFRIAEAKCAAEVDRRTVTTTIIRWFGTYDAFDKHVRENVQGHVLESIGPVLHVPFRYTVISVLVYYWDRFDVILSGGHTLGVGVVGYSAYINAILGNLVMYCCQLLAYNYFQELSVASVGSALAILWNMWLYKASWMPSLARAWRLLAKKHDDKTPCSPDSYGRTRL